MEEIEVRTLAFSLSFRSANRWAKG